VEEPAAQVLRAYRLLRRRLHRNAAFRKAECRTARMLLRGKMAYAYQGDASMPVSAREKAHV